MPELPESKSALKKLARRGMSTARRVRERAAERKEARDELIGAFIVLPLVRDVSANIDLLSNLGIDPKLQAAALSYAVSAFTRQDSMVSRVAWGSAVGAIGAYSWDSEGLLGGLFGG